MALSLHQISRWYKMLTGKSVWHVNQDIGKYFSKDSIAGYYNNMMEKVTKMPDLLDNNELPQLNLANDKFVYFPVAIFQYGLGAYDLYLQTKDQRYVRKFIQCANWAIEHQDVEGRWNNFFYVYPDTPYGAMAQGEAVSLLVRAYLYSKDEKYLISAQKGIDYMLKPSDKGGVTMYNEGDVVFLEYTHLPIVLNGWIFAWWGLYDYVLVTQDHGIYSSMMKQSLNTLLKYMPKFKNWCWSIYSVDKKIASPFYHNLHIAQMQAMYQITGIDMFERYSERWLRQQANPLYKGLAFIGKAVQKLLE